MVGSSVKKYFMSNEEGETWRRQDAVGKELREFSRKWMRRDEPPGTRIEVYDGWGALLETFKA